MNLQKFTILMDAEAQDYEEERVILLNLDHIVSIRPIKVTMPSREVVDGYWIRLSNGKKYRALTVPSVIKTVLNDDKYLGQSINQDQDQDLQALQ